MSHACTQHTSWMTASSGRHVCCRRTKFSNAWARAIFEAVSRLDAETILEIAVAVIMMRRRGHASTAKNMRNLTIGESKGALTRGRKRGLTGRGLRERTRESEAI